MEALKMERSAADNKYLHRDFHKTLDLGLAYLAEHYGEDSVGKYLHDVVKIYYAPLIEKIKNEGLSALESHIKRIYEIEEAANVCHTYFSGDTLSVKIDACPVLAYFQKSGYHPSRYFKETTLTLNEAIAELADIGYRLEFYDEKTGNCEYLFFTEKEQI